jgi:predicted  nucleic acid-binding Zn ribbon protein
MHEISIKFKADIDENEVWHAFYGLIGNLRENGQIVGRDTQAYIRNHQIFATLHTFTEEALTPQCFNDYVKKSIEHLEKLCDKTLIIKYLGSGEDEEKYICNCSQHDHFVLYRSQYSPILCGSCGKDLPLFKLPKMEDQRYWGINVWNDCAKACMVLDLSCSVGEKWAIKQQCDPNSQLSKLGRSIATKITEVTGVKTYYFIHNWSFRSKAKDIARPCPSCGGAWRLEKEIHGYMRYKCDTCLLMSAESTNAR